MLSTDINYSPQRILEIYALRWSIEVYFKEIKQGLGWMKEQTGSYIVHYASIHLAAIRYMMLYSLMLDDGRLKFGEIRNKISGAIEQLGFIALLWEFFKAILHGVLESFSKTLGKKTLIKIENAFQASIEEFLFCALQMDNQSVRAQIKAEKLGVDLGEPCNV